MLFISSNILGQAIGKSTSKNVEKSYATNSAAKKDALKINFLEKLTERISNRFTRQVSSIELEEVKDHISNALGVINLIFEDNLSTDQRENIASLKSSCSYLAKRFGLDLDSIESNAASKMHAGNQPGRLNLCSTIPTSKKNNKNNKNKILLICQSPIQKKILKNLMVKWGYTVDILSRLPSELDLITVLDFQLIVISKTAHQPTMLELKSLKALGQEFLILLNSHSISNNCIKEIPHISSPIDPDFLKYKLEKMFKQFKSAKIQKQIIRTEETDSLAQNS